MTEKAAEPRALAGQRSIYIASSWRNLIQPAVASGLRLMGHDVYDFRNPKDGDNGFHWSEIDPNWEQWDGRTYIEALQHPIAVDGFNSDFEAMKWADTFVLVQPCGRSAHLELGWAVGAGKTAVMLLGEDIEPELMAKMCNHVCASYGEMVELFDFRNKMEF